MFNIFGLSMLICFVFNNGMISQSKNDELEKAIKSIASPNLKVRENAQQTVSDDVLSIPLKHWIRMKENGYSKILQRHASEIQRHLKSQDRNIRSIAIGLAGRLRDKNNLGDSLLEVVIRDSSPDNRLDAFEALCFAHDEQKTILTKQVVDALLDSSGVKLDGRNASSDITGLVIFSERIGDILLSSGHTKSELVFLTQQCKPIPDRTTCLFSLVVLQRFGVEASEVAEKMIADSNLGDEFLVKEIARTALLISRNPRVLENSKLAKSEKDELLQDLAKRIEEKKARDIEFLAAAESMKEFKANVEWQLTQGFQIEKREALRILMMQEAKVLRMELQDSIRGCVENNDDETIRLANRVILELQSGEIKVSGAKK